MSRDTVFVYVYDVSSDRLRRRMAAILEEEGTRVQGCVFEVHADQAKAERIFRKLERERGAGDGLRMYCLTADGRRRSRTKGGAPLPEETEFWLL
jgi:CRISPR-associated protein Cas2